MHLSRPIFVQPIAISSHPSNPRILITGALGQIGSELCVALRQKYGADSVVATDIRRPRDGKMLSTHVADGGPFQYLDVQDATAMRRLVIDHRVDWLIHNSSIMSAKGELYPNLALDMNIAGTRHALEVAREMHLRVFIPSTIAVFGPSTQPKENTPDHALRDPSTVYGITKQFLEQLGTYYHKTFGVDFRSLRYPGILSYRTLPGGGTTDYAIHAIRAAARHPECSFSCGLAPHQALPMMHMEDCIRATLQVLEAPAEKFPDPSRRVYNVGSMSFSPAQLETEIRKYVSTYTFRYEPNHLQTIAETWPHSVNDQCAHSDWGWTPKYSFSDTVREMLEHFRSSSAQE